MVLPRFHQGVKTTLIYAHLRPVHLRAEVAKTARPATSPTMPEPVNTKVSIMR